LSAIFFQGQKLKLIVSSCSLVLSASLARSESLALRFCLYHGPFVVRVKIERKNDPAKRNSWQEKKHGECLQNKMCENERTLSSTSKYLPLTSRKPPIDACLTPPSPPIGVRTKRIFLAFGFWFVMSLHRQQPNYSRDAYKWCAVTMKPGSA